jgi:UDP-arabinose 4-epimerase
VTNVLVTGGAGYIGSHICKALAGAGHTPVAYDDLSRGHRSFVKWGLLIEADVLDTSALVRALTAHGIEAVIHCAALAYVGESWERPLDYFRINVNGAVSLMDAMKHTGVDRLVLSSSCSVYGAPDVLPVTEDAPLEPISPYGRTKALVEQMTETCATAYGFKVTALRYFNAAGADPDGEIGEIHDPETHVIPNAMRAALDDDYRLPVLGTDFGTPDGSAIRDFIHVSDLADGHVSALDKLSAGFTAYNLGTGQGYSVLEIVAAVEAALGKPVKHDAHPRRPGDPAHLVAAADKARAHLGWTPQRSDLATMIADAARFAGTLR